MDRDLLEGMLAEGLSLAAIGRRVGRHESTVAYWVDRYGLRATHVEKHASRGGLSRDQLVPLIEAGLSIAEIARRLDRSKVTVRHWLAKHGLRTAAGGRRSRAGAQEARQQGLAQTVLPCPHHGSSEHVRDTRGYYRCRRCRQEGVVRRRRKVKAILVAEAGGRCRLCGYDRCLAALEFHHVDPTTKRFGMAQDGMARSLERMRAEARKCLLLCSNCHAEVESGARSVSVVAQLDDPG